MHKIEAYLTSQGLLMLSKVNLVSLKELNKRVELADYRSNE